MYREFKYFLSKEINVSELKIILNFADKALPLDSTKVHVSVAMYIVISVKQGKMKVNQYPVNLEFLGI